jgi:hypothetical protein
VPCTRSSKKNACGRVYKACSKGVETESVETEICVYRDGRVISFKVGSFSIYRLVLQSLVSVGSTSQTSFLEWVAPLYCVQLFSHHQIWYFKVFKNISWMLVE